MQSRFTILLRDFLSNVTFDVIRQRGSVQEITLLKHQEHMSMQKRYGNNTGKDATDSFEYPKNNKERWIGPAAAVSTGAPRKRLSLPIIVCNFTASCQSCMTDRSYRNRCMSPAGSQNMLTVRMDLLA